MKQQIQQVIDTIDTALREWDAVKSGNITQAMVDRGNAIIAEILNGAK